MHIGSTRQWLQNLNFGQTSQPVHVYDESSIPLEESNETIFNPELPDRLPEAAAEAEIAPIITYPDKLFGFHIAQFSRNAWGNPYIPGNTLSGFYHSAILKGNFPQQWYDRPSGRLPDFHRMPGYPSDYAVIFEDIEFSRGSLEIADVKILNMTSDQSFGWKKYGRTPTNLPHPQKATSDYVETISEGESSLGNVRIRSQRTISEDQRDSFDPFIEIETALNDYAAAIIEREMAFYNQCKMNEGYDFYFTLSEKIKKVTSGFFVCVGWGIGWQAMFGPLHSPKSIEHIRQKHDLGKSNRQCPACKKQLRIDKFRPDKLFCYSCKKTFPFDAVVTQLFSTFPKSRKFVLKNHLPAFPLGWLRFDRNLNFVKSRNNEYHDIEINIMLKSSSIERTPILKPEEYPEGKSKTKHFKKKIKIPERGSFPTEFNIFFNKIAELEYIISINGDDINDDIDTTRLIESDSVDELLFHYSRGAKGIALTIRTGAVNKEQKNFIINRIWEIIDAMNKEEKNG